mmetsp:Transcript_21386/g.50267  ORF Transcript_21386/g.50267 Transcript_21386/m.50267 type:complete len:194 (+) Transcript_21386:23-604(+)
MDELGPKILNFWFGVPGSDIFGKSRKEWWVGTDFDKPFKDDFEPAYKAIMAGEHDAAIAEKPEHSLAAIILLDQGTRSMYRDLPEAFAGDEKAVKICRAGLEKGWAEPLKQISPFHYSFFCMPLLHSEKLEEQEMSLKCAVGEPGAATKNHHRIIQRFGRFPTRNKILGRQNTPEEEAFLATEWTGFMKKEGY